MACQEWKQIHTTKRCPVTFPCETSNILSEFEALGDSNPLISEEPRFKGMKDSGASIGSPSPLLLRELFKPTVALWNPDFFPDIPIQDFDQSFFSSFEPPATSAHTPTPKGFQRQLIGSRATMGRNLGTEPNIIQRNLEATKDGKRSQSSFTCTWPDCKETKTFARKSDFSKHMDKYTRPYACLIPSCNGINFGDKAGLLRHQREKHETARFYCQTSNCPRNRRGFARKRNLVAHVKSRHLSTSGTASSTALDTSKAPDSVESPDEMDEDPKEEEDDGSTDFRRVEVNGLELKLRELEEKKEKLAACRLKVDEDIQAVKRTMELVMTV